MSVRLLSLDKCAFFLVSNSDVGAQIYELVANSKEEKNKFVSSSSHLLFAELSYVMFN